MFDTSAVPIFMGQNYSAWKFKFQVLMMERGLWGFFDGTEKKPDNESDVVAWKKDQKAFATLNSRIGINLVSSVRMCIKLEASAHDAWKRLETMHVNKTLHGKILARNAFYTMKMHAGESMHEYATRVEELGETFMDLGGTVTKEDWILTLLCSLPKEWSTVIMTLDSVQDTWTKEMVVGRLLHEESRCRQFATESEGAAMFSGRASDWTPSKARNHEGNAHTASGDSDDSRESIVLLASDGTNTPSGAWFLDTGAAQHMTHLASFLTNVGTPGDVMRVVFGNDKSLPVVGVGSTHLIVDGGPVDITNVLHIPGVGGSRNGGGENEESDDDVVEVTSTVAATSSTPSSLPLALTHEQRICRPNTKYIDYATVAVGELDEERAAYCLATFGDDPSTHTEALASPDASLWKQAMEKELASIKENDVFELVDPPKGAYLVGCKWVLKKKLGPDGGVERYKARLVAQGYTQREGEHYSETFTPVTKATTLRVLLALAASLNLEVEQLDVCTAFLYGLRMEEVHMQQPPGYDDGSGRVWKLKRTLYSLKQSPRGWYKRIDNFLLQHGFARSECDNPLYVLKEGEKQLVILLYVDDIILFSDSKDLIREVKQRLGAEFAVRDLGPVTYYLGMHVDRDRANGTIHLHQE
ncbi:unnamed protein product, partial [Closterium sp. NIES-54]